MARGAEGPSVPAGKHYRGFGRGHAEQGAKNPALDSLRPERQAVALSVCVCACVRLCVCARVRAFCVQERFEEAVLWIRDGGNDEAQPARTLGVGSRCAPHSEWSPHRSAIPGLSGGGWADVRMKHRDISRDDGKTKTSEAAEAGEPRRTGCGATFESLIKVYIT